MERRHVTGRVPGPRARLGAGSPGGILLEALIIAYSCEPGRGSEPGAGWGLVEAAASFARCVVLVGPEHAATLEAYVRDHPDFAASFVSVPEPPWRRWAGEHRIGRFIAYLGWLRRARRTARRLAAELDFDVAHHATFSVYWLPSPVADLGPPAVWGPVGGAVVTPLRLWPLLGWRGMAAEILDGVGVFAGSLLPATRRTWRRVAVPIAQNDPTRNRLPRAVRPSVAVWNHALFVDVPAHPEPTRGRYLLWAAALESRKGPALAVRALAHTEPDVRLIVVGDGPERGRLERLARRLGVAERIDFRGRLPRAELAALMAGAAAAVHTGLREEGGLALAEAMTIGTPVVVLDVGGAGTIARAAVDPARVALVAPGGPADTARRLADAMTRFWSEPPAGRGPLLDRAAAGRLLEDAYRRAAAWGTPDGV